MDADYSFENHTTECSSCKEHFSTYVKGEDNVYRPWYDVQYHFPCCSESCVESLEEDCGWEYIDELEWLRDEKKEDFIKPEHEAYLTKLEKAYNEWRKS